MENFSENKQKRGRPLKHSVFGKGSIKEFVKKEQLEGRTDRTKMNQYSSISCVLNGCDGFIWL